MDSSLFVGTVKCEDTEGSRELILLLDFFFFFLQHYNSVTVKVFLFTAQGKSAFVQFKEVDPAFEMQHSTLTGKEKVISNSKIQILISAKRGTSESAWVLIFWMYFECRSNCTPAG